MTKWNYSDYISKGRQNIKKHLIWWINMIIYYLTFGDILDYVKISLASCIVLRLAFTFTLFYLISFFPC